MRITINNYDNLDKNIISQVVKDIDYALIEKFKSYISVYAIFKVKVYYRKTKIGYAIDIHKNE